MVIGIAIAAAGVTLYLGDRSGGDVVPDVRSDTLEQTTTTAEPPVTEAPTTTLPTMSTEPVTTTPEPTVP